MNPMKKITFTILATMILFSCQKDPVIKPLTETPNAFVHTCFPIEKTDNYETRKYEYNSSNQLIRIYHTYLNRPPSAPQHDTTELEYNSLGQLIKVSKRTNYRWSTASYTDNKLAQVTTYVRSGNDTNQYHSVFEYASNRLVKVGFDDNNFYKVHWKKGNISALEQFRNGTSQMLFQHYRYDDSVNYRFFETYLLVENGVNDISDLYSLCRNNQVCSTFYLERQSSYNNCYLTYNEKGYVISDTESAEFIRYTTTVKWNCP
jgi:hypothetical protein